MSERKERCETCDFGVGEFRLECRRKAPIVYVNNRGDEIAAWPPVAFDYWCGEYKPREGVDKDAKQTLNDTALDEASREFLDALGGKIFHVPSNVFAHTGAAMKIAIAKYLEVAK